MYNKIGVLELKSEFELKRQKRTEFESDLKENRETREHKDNNEYFLKK